MKPEDVQYARDRAIRSACALICALTEDDVENIKKYHDINTQDVIFYVQHLNTSYRGGTK